ncbi:MAG: SufE family protein [Armatimonadetes bacterium]|nr:SufE family protein [Armatimonadota bacterium]
MKTKPPHLEQFLSDLAQLSDRNERIEYLISLAHDFVPYADAPDPLPEDNRVRGCESEVFAFSTAPEGKIHLEFVVLNKQGLSAMALGKILQDSFNGMPVDSIQCIDQDIVKEIFGRELSMGKAVGLANTVSMVKSQLLSSCSK